MGGGGCCWSMLSAEAQRVSQALDEVCVSLVLSATPLASAVCCSVCVEPWGMTARPSPRASRMQAEHSALAREMRCSCKCWCSREVIRGRKRLPLSPASAGTGIWGGDTAVTQADTCSRAELVLSPYVLDRRPLAEELALTVARWSPPGRWAGNAFGRRSFVPLGWTLQPRWPQDSGRGQQGWAVPSCHVSSLEA